MFCCICSALIKLLFQHTQPSSKIGNNTYYTLTTDDDIDSVQSEEVPNAEDYLLGEPYIYLPTVYYSLPREYVVGGHILC